jgi:uncharacterized membrane protein
MEFKGVLFEGWLWWLALTTGLACTALAGWHAPWRRLMAKGRFNVWCGAILALMLLWLLRTEVVPGLEFHLLCATSLTLMFGWSLALLGIALALLGISLAGWSDWHNYPFNFVSLGLLPVSLSYFSLLVARTFLPKHFFIFIFINAFITAGLVLILSGYATTALLVLAGHSSYQALESSVMPFFPMMFFPEAMLNGWIMTLLVVFRPEWVYSFRDEEYLERP